MTRTDLFNAIRPFAPNGKFTDNHVKAIDALADSFGLAAVDGAQGATAKPLSAIPDDYWPMLSKIESGDRPYIKASTSSASGLYQFIKSTWIGEGGRWGSDPTRAFGGFLTTPDEQLMRAKSFTQKNADALVRAGIPVNKASLYAAHFLGVGTAIKVIGAPVTASAEALAGPAATKANPSILKGKTVAQFLTWLHGKTGEWAR